MNKRKVKCLLRSFRDGATIMAACKSADIARNTLWLWCKRWPNLDKRIEQIKNARTSFVIDAVYINAINGKEASQKLWLINKGGWRSGDGTTVKVDVPIDVKPTTQVNIPVATPEEAEKVKAYAQLIRSHNLVSRTLGQDGYESVLGGDLEGQSGEPSITGPDSPRDSVAH